MSKNTSKSKLIAQKTIMETFKILQKNGGEMRGKDVVDTIRETVKFNEYEKHQYERTGYIRWESILHFYTIDCIKAGFLRKQKGIWYLTQEGEDAIKLGKEKLLDAATKKYREWDAKNHEKQNREENDEDLNIETTNDKTQKQTALLGQYETSAIEGLREYLIEKNPYEFQRYGSYLTKSNELSHFTYCT